MQKIPLLLEPAEEPYGRFLSYYADTKSLISPCALRNMVQKFEINEKLDILPGRGRKKIPSSSAENVATTVVETSSHSLDGGVNVSDVSLHMICPISQ